MKAMTCNVRVTLVCRTKNLIDATDEFGSCEHEQHALRIPVCCDGMIHFQLVFDVVLVDSMNGVQWSLLTWDPYVISVSLLGLRPRKMEVACAILRGRFCNVGENRMTTGLNFSGFCVGGSNPPLCNWPKNDRRQIARMQMSRPDVLLSAPLRSVSIAIVIGTLLGRKDKAGLSSSTPFMV
jgi:hypothetical protein